MRQPRAGPHKIERKTPAYYHERRRQVGKILSAYKRGDRVSAEEVAKVVSARYTSFEHMNPRSAALYMGRNNELFGLGYIPLQRVFIVGTPDDFSPTRIGRRLGDDLVRKLVAYEVSQGTYDPYVLAAATGRTTREIGGFKSHVRANGE